jgi:LAO/AO transport system kinase
VQPPDNTTSTDSRAVKLSARILASQAAAIARGITWLENGSPDGAELLGLLAPDIGKAHRIGVTGPPGAGKSTLVDALAGLARRRKQSVGIVAVDPSSPFTGGALLGDRVRMARSLEDPEVFARSMATRGALGGLCRTVQEAADVLDASGKQKIFLETVGVGQSELAVAQSCDTCVVVLVPEAGGMVQAMKAGLMEIADIFVVNKSDRPGADEMRRQLIEAASFLNKDGWAPPVIETVALDQRGINQLFDQIEAHNHWLRGSHAEHDRPTGHDYPLGDPNSGLSQVSAGSSSAPTSLVISDSELTDPTSENVAAYLAESPIGEDGGRLERKRLQQHQARIRESVKAALEENLWGDNEINQQLSQSAQQLRTGQISFPVAVEQVWTQVLQHLSHQTTITNKQP